MILTAFSQRDLVERARDAGAMAYLVKPFDQGDLVPAIEMAVSRFTELAPAGVARSRTSPSGSRPARLVDRAKGVLQQQLGLSEPEAFRWIQKTAMDLRLSMRQVAEGVVTHGPGLGGGADDELGVHRSWTTSSVSSGATSRAGSKSATLTCLRSSSRKATRAAPAHPWR